MADLVSFHVEGFDEFQKLDFDKKEVKKAMRQAGRLVQRDAKRSVSRKSASGGYPHRRTGRLRRSITARVSRSGFMVIVKPRHVTGMPDVLYPMVLHYGRKTKDGRKWRIKPMRNYIAEALEAQKSDVGALLFEALTKALEPGKR